MDFGYYRVDTVQRGKFAKKVADWTNIAYVGSVDAGFSEDSDDTRAAKLKGILTRITNAGLNVALDLEMHAGRLPWGRTLKIAKPFWDKVKYVILDDERDPDVWEAKEDIRLVRHKMEKLGLEERKLGATFTPTQVLGTDPNWFTKFDFTNIEAYNSDPTNASAEGVRVVINSQLAHVPGPVTVVMQAYDRNGAIKHIQTMVDIQHATWDSCKNEPFKVDGIFMFAYGREGGTISYPQLAQAHKQIHQEVVI